MRYVYDPNVVNPADSPTCPWVKYPLIALAIISIGPSVIAPILYLALRTFHVNELDHSRIIFDAGTFEMMLFLPFLFALFNWPFLVLYAVCRRKTKKEWPSIRSIRLAMWVSMVAMCLPSVLFFIGSPAEMISEVYDRGQGTGFALVIFLLLPVPLLGLIGWFAGRFIAWESRA